MNKSMEQLVVEELDKCVDDYYRESHPVEDIAHSLCTKIIEAYGMDEDRIEEILRLEFGNLILGHQDFIENAVSAICNLIAPQPEPQSKITPTEFDKKLEVWLNSFTKEEWLGKLNEEKILWLEKKVTELQGQLKQSTLQQGEVRVNTEIKYRRKK